MTFNFSDEMERTKSRKSQSSVDVRQTNEPSRSASSRRHGFFSSFRKKFRGEKYKDKNSNIEHISASHPNIFRSSCHSPSASQDDGESADYTERRLHRQQSMSSGRSRTNSDGRTIDIMSSEEREDVDSGIAVIETTTISQVGVNFSSERIVKSVFLSVENNPGTHTKKKVHKKVFSK